MDVLRQLGKTLRRIHELRQAPFVESGLFPVDHSSEELRTKLEATFARIVEAIHDLQEEWPLDLLPEGVAVKALGALPLSIEGVALHSNPAPEHVFVDPRTGAFQGLIDYADAYISHPAFDLRPWRDLQERTAVLEGYSEEGGASDTFLATLRVGQVLGEMAAIARRRQAPVQAEENLHRLLSEL